MILTIMIGGCGGQEKSQTDSDINSIEAESASSKASSKKFVLNGFKGFEWGSEFSEMQKHFGLSYLGPDEGIRQIDVFRANIPSLGSAVIDTCKFSFYRNQFCGVTIIINSCNDSETILRQLNKVYGAMKLEMDLEGVTIHSKTTDETVRVFYWDINTCIGKLLMLSTEIIGQTVEDAKTSLNNIKSDY